MPAAGWSSRLPQLRGVAIDETKLIVGRNRPPNAGLGNVDRELRGVLGQLASAPRAAASRSRAASAASTVAFRGGRLGNPRLLRFDVLRALLLERVELRGQRFSLRSMSASCAVAVSLISAAVTRSCRMAARGREVRRIGPAGNTQHAAENREVHDLRDV